MGGLAQVTAGRELEEKAAPAGCNADYVVCSLPAETTGGCPPGQRQSDNQATVQSVNSVHISWSIGNSCKDVLGYFHTTNGWLVAFCSRR